MLADAFDEHPLFRFAFPKAASRSKILQTLFTTVLKDAIHFGRVEVACSHKIVGMLICYPPGSIRCPNPESCVSYRNMRAPLRPSPPWRISSSSANSRHPTIPRSPPRRISMAIR